MSSSSVVSSSAAGGTTIDVANIVSQLMSTEQQPITNLQNQQANSQALISAYGTVQSALSTFQSAMSALTNVSQFQGITASSSNSSALTASAATGATPGTYSISVSSLAQAQSLVAGGVASETAAIGGSGTTTLTFDLGTIVGNTLNATTGTYGTTLNNASVDASGTTVTVASTANLAVGATISGDGFPPGTTITSITNGTTFVTSAADTNTSATGLTLQAGATFTSNGNGSKTVTINSTNNSLQGIAAAINAANIGVTASIINDGTGSPYRLTLTSNASGASNSIKIAVTGPALSATTTNNSNVVTVASTANLAVGATITGAGIPAGSTITSITDGTHFVISNNATADGTSVALQAGGDPALSSLLAEDPGNASGQSLTQTTAGQNANLTVNGVAVTSSSNTVSSAVQGVSFNLLQTTTSPISVSLTQNTSAASTAVSSFVSAYNALQKSVSNVTAFNASTQTGAILQGDFAVSDITTQLHAILNTPVQGAGALATLSDIGVTFQSDGTLAVNQTQLNTALTNNFSDIAALFNTVGQTTDNQISYTSATSTAQAGTYPVNITQLATQGNVAGSAAAITSIDSSNNTLYVTVNGTTTAVTLTTGNYTAASLATEVQTEINGASALSAVGASVTVSQSGGKLTITSNSYGSSSNVAISGAGASDLLGTPTATAGVDIAGTINGQAATGSGQYLTSSAGNSSGLKIQVTGGALGSRGTVSYSNGYAGILEQWAATQDSSTGAIASAVAGQNSTIKSIGTQITQEQSRLSLLQQSYIQQYTALDQLLASMNSTSSYLTQQFAALTKST